MEKASEYMDAYLNMGTFSHEKLDPKEALKDQFAIWVAQKISDLEGRIAALENPEASSDTSNTTEDPAEDTEAQA